MQITTEKAKSKQKTGAASGIPTTKKAQPLPAFWSADEPEMPDYLDDEAKKEWRYILESMKAGGEIAKVDKTMLAMYCVAYSRWREAEENIQIYGTAYFTGEGKAQKLQENPWVEISRRFCLELRTLASALGFSPAARSKSKTAEPVKQPKKQNAAQSYFNKNN